MSVNPETGEIVEDVNIEVLTRPFERAAIEQRDGGGGRVFDYIAAETCIRRLNEATHNHWSFRVIPETIQWIDGGTDRNGNPEQILFVLGELTIPGLGSRQGFGVQRTKLPVQNGEDMLKGAASDALKKCSTLFGVALELYGPELDVPQDQQPIRQPQTRRPPQGTAIDNVRQISGAHTLDVREGSKPSPRAERAAQQAPQDGRDNYPYEKVFQPKASMADINDYMRRCGLRGGNKGETIRAVNQYGREKHGLDYNIVIGTGDWLPDYKANDVFPRDIGNALAHWKKQESLGGAEEAREAADRDTTGDDDFDDSVPF